MTLTSLSPSVTRRERLFSVEEYLRMVRVGILTENDQVELLAGRIVEKMPRNPPHDSALHRLLNLLGHLLPSKYIVRSQSVIRLVDSVPEPNLAIVGGPASRYDESHPAAEDCLLVVEVADSSLGSGQENKGALYARAGIPIYWIVNLVDRRIEIYSDPTGPDHFPAYRKRKDMAADGVVQVPVPGKRLTVKVSEVLPGKRRG